MKNRTFTMIFSAALFIMLIVWFAVSVSNMDSSAKEKQSASAENEIINAAVLCYSIEGEYPPSFEYLKENYDIKINEKKYIVSYDYFGANIRPTVTVIERQSDD